MNYRTASRLTLGICVLLLTVASPGAGNDAVAGRAYGSTTQSEMASSWTCLPQYSEPERILTLNRPTDLHHLVSADLSGDGWPDVVLARALWQSKETFELDVLLNDGGGNLVLGTSEVFSETVPSVMDARELVLADFNGDGRPDMFFADQGMDAPPQPGYQNTLVLSAPGGKLVDATGNLPQQSDMAHSAAAADIDGDEDVDLYVGNIWGQTDLPPQICRLPGVLAFALPQRSNEQLTKQGHLAAQAPIPGGQITVRPPVQISDSQCRYCEKRNHHLCALPFLLQEVEGTFSPTSRWARDYKRPATRCG